MASFVLLCDRQESLGSAMADRVRRACGLLIPDHIDVDSVYLHQRPGLVLGVVDPSSGAAVEVGSVCLGQAFCRPAEWSAVGSPVPEGSYAICRSTHQCVELLADSVGSRTIWYYSDEDTFLASSSQRALVALLGDFRLNPEAVDWLVSSGSLGPEAAWDRRLRRLRPDSRLILDRPAWRIGVEERPVVFRGSDAAPAEFEDRLKDVLAWACESVETEAADWRLLLSGGHDSRALLLFLTRTHVPRCITWGLKSSLSDSATDACVARELARHFGAEHQFQELNTSGISPDVFLDRFLALGEGRVDHISAYLDGFRTWRSLQEAGVAGVIRGDSAFGWCRVRTEQDVRRSIGALMFSDHFSPADLEALEITPQIWPRRLERQPPETLEAWRDRLYHEYRIPVVLAALSDLKTRYVEVVNPFLSRRVVELVREMPDELREERRLFVRIVDNMGPRIRFAKLKATSGREDAASGHAYRELFHDELSSAEAAGILPAAFCRHLLDGLHPRRPGGNRLGRAKAAIKRALPVSFQNALRPWLPAPRVPLYTFALRAVLTCRMNRILAADANACKVRSDGIRDSRSGANLCLGARQERD